MTQPLYKHDIQKMVRVIKSATPFRVISDLRAEPEYVSLVKTVQFCLPYAMTITQITSVPYSPLYGVTTFIYLNPNDPNDFYQPLIFKITTLRCPSFGEVKRFIKEFQKHIL
jgi:hypothetical protein